MKKILKLFLFASTVFILYGCSISINEDKTIFSPRKAKPYIPDGEFLELYEPFDHLDPLKSESDFAENLNTSGDFPFYPANKENKIDEYIEKHGFVSPESPENYEIGAAYFSENYNTIYVAYNEISLNEHLSAYELYRIERHAEAYFISDDIRGEDLNYLRAILIYPDDSSSCSYSTSHPGNVRGCANYAGKYSTISLNSIPNMDRFLNEQGNNPPARKTFAHEWGHIATFYHIVKKGDESYLDYLEKRLDDNFDLVYPNGLPGAYSSDPELYNIQPEEILADDYVELLYYRQVKFEGDYENYDLIYDNRDTRVSLTKSEYDSFQYISPFDPEIDDYARGDTFEQLFDYYTSNFFVPIREEITPVVIKPEISTINTIEYFTSVVHLGNESKLKQIHSQIDINLIAVEKITRHNQEYYRVVLSPLSYVIDSTHDKKDVAYHMGYVYAHEYYQSHSSQVWTWEPEDQLTSTTVNINGQVSNEFDLWLVPFYDFVYIAGEISGNYIEMYDYLNEDVNGQTFLVPENMSFLEEIN